MIYSILHLLIIVLPCRPSGRTTMPCSPSGSLYHIPHPAVDPTSPVVDPQAVPVLHPVDPQAVPPCPVPQAHCTTYLTLWTPPHPWWTLRLYRYFTLWTPPHPWWTLMAVPVLHPVDPQVVPSPPVDPQA